MDVRARPDPREPIIMDGRSGLWTARETREGLPKEYQSVQVAQGCLDRKRAVTHDPFRLSHGGL